MPSTLSKHWLGFSLLELVLVLSIVTILAAIAAPRYAMSVARNRADFAARRVVADLAMAQSSAKAASSARTVLFSVETNKYQISGMSPLDGASGSYTVQLAQPPYEARLVSADLGGDSQITFDGWGIPDSGGTVVLTAGPNQKRVLIDAETGKARVQ